MNFEPGAYIESVGALVNYLEENEWIFWDGCLEDVDNIWMMRLSLLHDICKSGQFREAFDPDPDDHF